MKNDNKNTKKTNEKGDINYGNFVWTAVENDEGKTDQPV